MSPVLTIIPAPINKEITLGKYDECISIINARCHPFLDAGIFILGQFLNPDKRMKEHSSIIFKLKGANPPGEQIKRKVESVLKRTIKKLPRHF